MIRSNHWRRPCAILATAVVAGGVLAGCSGAASGDEDGPVSLTMTIWGNETDKEVMAERLALAKEEFPDITVKVQQIPDEYDTKLQTMVSGGQAPDILMISEAVNVLSSRGQLVDLNPAFEEAGIDPEERFGGAIETYTTDGKLWASPDRAGAMVMYYNKDIFDAQGVEYPTGDWTWDDFRAAAEQVTVREGEETTSWGFGAGDWWAWYMTFMYQNGGEVLDAEGAPVANSTENVEAMEFYNAMVFEDRSTLSPLDYADAGLDNGQPDPLFARGQLAMEWTGFWNIAALNQTELNWDIAPLPRGTDAAVPAFGSGLAVSTQSDHQKEATELVLFLSSLEAQMPIVTSGLDVPANIEASLTPEFQEPEWNTRGVNLAAFSDSAPHIYSPPLVPEWNEIQNAFRDGLAPVWNENAPVEPALDEVQASLERILR